MDASVAALEEFLRARGTTWSEDKIAMSQEGVVHGFGVVATKDIKKGEELFRITKASAFGVDLEPLNADSGKGANEKSEERAAEGKKGSSDEDDDSGEEDSEDDDDEDDDNVENRDSQATFAVHLLDERAKGSKVSEWAPLWQTLPDPATYDDLPWLWDPSETVGTELEGPVAKKRERLHEEYKALGRSDFTEDQFARACGVIISHLNPFFGGAVVPFVYMLNCSKTYEANVAFEEQEGATENDTVVVGRALKAIEAGEELMQSYGNDISSAELLYRCGFVLPEAELRNVVDLNFDRIPVKEESAKDEILEFLEQAGILASCSWDGLGDLKTIEMHTDDTGRWGRTEVRIACAVAELDKETLKKVIAFSTDEGEHKSFSKKLRFDRMDRTAILLSAALDALCKESWPPSTVDFHKNLVSKARKSQLTKKETESDSEDKSEKDDAEELLWEVLRPVLSKSAIDTALKVFDDREAEQKLNKSERPEIKHLLHVENAVLPTERHHHH